MNRWLPDELALAGPEHVDPDAVAVYEQKARFDPDPDLALLRGHGLGSDSTVVDLGAGTGVFAFAAARVAQRVVAVDASPAMVDTWQSKPTPNVEYVHAGFLTYEHTEAVALTRIASILRPRGVLRLRDLVYSFEPGEADAVLEAWIAGGGSDSSAGWTRDELRAHVPDEHSTFGWILEGMLQRAGFDIEDARYDESRIYAGYVAIKRWTCLRDSP